MVKNIKPFDLEAAKKGAKVCTRGGFPVRILAYDLHNLKCICAAVTDQDELIKNGDENSFMFYPDGTLLGKWEQHRFDLMIEEMEKNIKKKVILTLCKSFPATHSRAGEPTGFGEKIKTGGKIHTVRFNNQDKSGRSFLWDKREKDINSGRKYLSVRQWSQRPYHSEQEELGTYDKIGLQHIKIVPGNTPLVFVDGKKVPVEDVAKNDGLSVDDFLDWFGDKPFSGVIVHFTNFRY